MAEDTAFKARTLLDLPRYRAENDADKVVFDYCQYSPGGQEHLQLSYHELDIRARAIASTLQRQGAAGECVLVMCPSGLDFITGLFGCIYAGAVAVPVHPPMRNRLISRVASIVADTQARFALTTTELEEQIRAVVDESAAGGSRVWCATDAVASDAAREWVARDVDASAPVLVQYTSGSTSSPKGVVLTHRNLLHNLEAIHRASGAGESSLVASWLPLHHDMGLIGCVLGTLYMGATAYLMPPEAFIQHPMRWLETISRYGATVSTAPNFAYELCVERSSPQERAGLDLSKWSTAMSGAEVVRPATLKRFADAFAVAGFRATAFQPVYGLAEATLLVSAETASPEPVLRHVDPVALRENHVVEVLPEYPRAATLVGCGAAAHGIEIAIVDPEMRRLCRADEIGEIWVAAASVAQSYLGKPAETEETFSAFLADTGRGPFLRTGDMGFLLEGELFVTGRLKDLVIIRGANYYPNDIEATAQASHQALLSGRGAAFSVTPASGGGEQLIVVQEVDPQRIGETDVGEVIGAIRTAITEEHQIQAHAVVLVEPLRIPTTSSGKIRRSACRQRFMEGELEVFAQWHVPTPCDAHPAAPPAEATPARAAHGAEDLAAWLVSRLSHELGLLPTEIDTSQPFAYYGLDSVHAIQLTTELEAWLGRKLSPTLAYDYPTIDLLSRRLAEDALADKPTAAAAENDGGARADRADDPIAIIGIGCRFPGADGPAAFWRLLADGLDAITEVPPDRWGAEASGSAAPRWGGFLDQVDQFDAQFFGISPREASRMDPQQRLLLEVAWEALEDAGQVPEGLAGSRTGVFTGVSTSDYQHLQLSQPALIDVYSGTGTAPSIAANRLSYFFDFRGPSVTVDTACSSSLVAIHQACRSLRDGECTLALAGGVNVILSPGIGVNFSKVGVMAADGRCKTFDARADGWVRGEGAGIVVLKPLSRALADGDPIYAAIRGSAINQDGRTNGLMAPNRLSQEAVLAEAYERAGLSPGVVQYVEAQGSGTSLGDAIEAQALGRVLAQGRTSGSRCVVGSVKTNIGHLEAAAGVAGLIKVALALHHRAIPPTINFAEPNQHIPFDSLPIQVAQTFMPWPENGGRAVAGVSAFGFGGTNAHVVLTEAPQVRATQPTEDTEGRAELLPLSARSPEALTELAARYELALAAGVPLADLCHTAGARRGHYNHRLAVVGGSPAELSESLAAYRRGVPRPGLFAEQCRAGQGPGVVFIFSGQGSQWCGMGQRLRAEEPVFREALGACDLAMRPHLEGSLLTELLADQTDFRLSDVGIVQPAIFAVQVALAALWRSLGVEPQAVIGHGLGEVAAAHVAGALSLDDAARVICGSAHLVRRLSRPGAVLVAELSLAEAQDLIADQQSQVVVTASNSHRSTVLSGELAELTDLVIVLQERGRSCRWVKAGVVSRSQQLEAIRSDLRDVVAGLQPMPTKVPMYSTVTGDLLADGALDGAYWFENICSPVHFSAAVRRLLDSGRDTFLEISPHSVLLSAVREDADDLDRSCTLLPSMRRDDQERTTFLASLATLYTRGQSLAWERLHPSGARCVAAPTYPWQRTRCWLDTPSVSSAPTRHATTDQLPSRGGSSVSQQTVFSEVDSNRALMPVLRGQRLRGAFLPAATQLKSVFSVAAGAFGTGRRRLRDVVSKRSPEGGQPAAAGGQVSEVSMNDLLGGADQQERRRLLESYLRDQAARKLGLTASRLDSHLPLNHFGIDSLMAMELRTEVERDLGIVVPIVQLLDGPTVAGLAEWLDGQLFGEATAVLNPTVAADTRATEHNDAAVSAVPGATDVTGTRWMDLLTQVPEISDDDVDELLSELLAAREYQDEG